MDIINLILRAQGEDGLRRIGGQFGLDEAQTQRAMETLAPALAAGMRRNMASPEGAGALLKALAGGEHARYLDDPDALAFDNVKPAGDAILGHVLGSKDASRALAAQAAQATGVSDSILKKMLPVIAPLLMGALFRMLTGGGAAQEAPREAPSSGGGLGDMIRDVLGGGSGGGEREAPSSGGGLEGMIRDVLGSGGDGGEREAPSSGGGLEGMIRDVLGGGAESGESAGRGRDILEDILGRGTDLGNAGEELLNSVERRLRGM